MAKALLLAGASVVAALGGLGISAGSDARTPQQTEPLCRRAPALAQLPAEPRLNSQQPNRNYERAGDGVYPAPPPPPSPPPPPPPPIMAEPVAEMSVPAPAPPAATASREGASDVVVTGSRVESRTGEVRAAPPVASPVRPDGARESYNRPPAGLLTAGDHDDVLNPLLYARYVRNEAQQLGQSIRALPVLDTSRTLTIDVQDRAGRSAPFVPVKITCADGNSLTYATQADGKVLLFPGLDRLGRTVTIEAGGVRRRVDIAADAGAQSQQLVIGGSAKAVRKLDLMIALDTTGSMGDEISFLQSELRSILDGVRARHPGLDLRVGLVAYRDVGDDFVTSTTPLTGDFNALQRVLARQSGTGGGDTPEAMEQALIRAVDQSWRPDAVKSMLLVADAPPHDENVAMAFAAAEAARERRIHIVPIAASGVDDSAQYLMRAMAAATQSRYVFLTDDSGIGNAHAEPSVDCYVVTKLASSIRRVIDSQISGQRIEPFPQEAIRVVGQYDHGRCILPPNWQ